MQQHPATKYNPGYFCSVEDYQESLEGYTAYVSQIEAAIAGGELAFLAPVDGRYELHVPAMLISEDDEYVGGTFIAGKQLRAIADEMAAHSIDRDLGPLAMADD
jgi:hypothetical protein